MYTRDEIKVGNQKAWRHRSTESMCDYSNIANGWIYYRRFNAHTYPNARLARPVDSLENRRPIRCAHGSTAAIPYDPNDEQNNLSWLA